MQTHSGSYDSFVEAEWEQHWDEYAKVVYYYNRLTGDEKPELPAGTPIYVVDRPPPSQPSSSAPLPVPPAAPLQVPPPAAQPIQEAPGAAKWLFWAVLRNTRGASLAVALCAFVLASTEADTPAAPFQPGGTTFSIRNYVYHVLVDRWLVALVHRVSAGVYAYIASEVAVIALLLWGRLPQHAVHLMVDHSNLAIGLKKDNKEKFGASNSGRRRIHFGRLLEFMRLSRHLQWVGDVDALSCGGELPTVAPAYTNGVPGLDARLHRSWHRDAQEAEDLRRTLRLSALQRRVGYACVAGSVSAASVGTAGGGVDAPVWRYARDAGFETALLARVYGREHGVDELLHQRIADATQATTNGQDGSSWYVPIMTLLGLVPTARRAHARGTLVLASGDGNNNEGRGGFVEYAEEALRAGLDVEVLAFASSMSGRYRALAKRWPPGRVTLVALDNHVRSFTYDVETEGWIARPWARKAAGQ